MPRNSVCGRVPPPPPVLPAFLRVCLCDCALTSPVGLIPRGCGALVCASHDFASCVRRRCSIVCDCVLVGVCVRLWPQKHARHARWHGPEAGQHAAQPGGISPRFRRCLAPLARCSSRPPRPPPSPAPPQSTLVFGFGVGFYYNWKLTLVILGFTPIMAICGAAMKVSFGCPLAHPPRACACVVI